MARRPGRTAVSEVRADVPNPDDNTAPTSTFVNLTTMLRFAAILACMPLIAQVPAARRDPVTETIHGVKLTDPYRWLEDKDSPATRAWIDEADKYTKTRVSKRP